MRRTAPVNPERGKAQGRIDPRPNMSRGNGPQTGIEAQKSKPASSPAHPPFRPTSNRRMSHPDENQSGRMIGSNGTWARTGRNAVLTSLAAELARRVHPVVGANLRREEPQERHRARQREGPLARSGCECPDRRGSGTPRQGTRRRMTRFGRQSRSGGARSGWIVCERAERIHRSHPHERSKTNEMRATGRLPVVVAKRSTGGGFDWKAPLVSVRHPRAPSHRLCPAENRKDERPSRGPGRCAGAIGANVVAGVSGGRLPRTARVAASVC